MILKLHFDKNLSSASNVNDKLDTYSTKCKTKYNEDYAVTPAVHNTSFSEVVQKPESKALDLPDDRLASAISKLRAEGEAFAFAGEPRKDTRCKACRRYIHTSLKYVKKTKREKRKMKPMIEDI